MARLRRAECRDAECQESASARSGGSVARPGKIRKDLWLSPWPEGRSGRSEYEAALGLAAQDIGLYRKLLRCVTNCDVRGLVHAVHAGYKLIGGSVYGCDAKRHALRTRFGAWCHADFQCRFGAALTAPPRQRMVPAMRIEANIDPAPNEIGRA